MHPIWVAVHQGPTGTRMLATAGPQQTLLQARLEPEPQHHRGLAALLEGLALWQGAKAHAVLAVDDPHDSFVTNLLRTCFGECGPEPLYTLTFAATPQPPRLHHARGGLGDFRDLRRLLRAEVTR